MKSVCVYEDRNCVNCGDRPLIEVVQMHGVLDMAVSHLMIVYVLEGGVEATFGIETGYPLTEGDMMLFPPGTRLYMRASGSGEARLVVLRIESRIVLCDQTVFGDKIVGLSLVGRRHSHIEATPMVRLYMDMLVENITGPLCCYRFMELKISELFHYLRAYYPSDLLAEFVKPLMGTNSQFMYFIWTNYRDIHTLAQFARLSNSSLSAFKVKFKAATGMAPSVWLTEQRVRNVFHDIAAGTKSLKEISDEYRFSSPSHLGTFCRKHFGKSPGEIRRHPRSAVSSAELSR